MGNFGLKIAKPGYDVRTAEDKNLAFNSARPCFKFIQVEKVSAVSDREISFNGIVQFPIKIFLFLYDSSDSYYKPVKAEFDSTKLYLTGGKNSGSYYYYFVCYA